MGNAKNGRCRQSIQVGKRSFVRDVDARVFQKRQRTQHSLTARLHETWRDTDYRSRNPILRYDERNSPRGDSQQLVQFSRENLYEPLTDMDQSRSSKFSSSMNKSCIPCEFFEQINLYNTFYRACVCVCVSNGKHRRSFRIFQNGV